jgi:phosphate starvation-inducible PhoH-like protein
MKQQKRMSRREKVQEQSTNPHVNRKANSWTESYGINSIKLTSTQQELSHKIHNNTLVFVDSVAGSGKSLTVLYSFVKEYLKDNTKNLIVIRTPVEAGLDKLGALPDDYKAKTEPHFASTKKILEQLLSRGKVETDMDHRIHFKVPNYVLGSTFDNSLILIDEAQQLPANILKLLLERIGINSKCVVVGDSTQLYTGNDNKRNGLKDAIPRFFKEDGTPKYEEVQLHRFGVSDIMRSDICKVVVTAYTGLV